MRSTDRRVHRVLFCCYILESSRGIPFRVLATLWIVLFSLVVHAENAQPQPLVGRRVRVMMTNASGTTDRLVAKVAAADERTLTLEREGVGSSRVIVQRSTVMSLERSLAKSRKGHGAAVGLLIGGVTGAILGYAVGDDSEGVPFCTFDGCATLGPFGPSRVEGAALLGFALGSIGAGVGAWVSPGERWERIQHVGVHFGVGPVADGGLGIQCSFSFKGSR